jgi:hypothetical protein
MQTGRGFRLIPTPNPNSYLYKAHTLLGTGHAMSAKFFVRKGRP